MAKVCKMIGFFFENSCIWYLSKSTVINTWSLSWNFIMHNQFWSMLLNLYVDLCTTLKLLLARSLIHFITFLFQEKKIAELLKLLNCFLAMWRFHWQHVVIDYILQSHVTWSGARAWSLYVTSATEITDQSDVCVGTVDPVCVPLRDVIKVTVSNQPTSVAWVSVKLFVSQRDINFETNFMIDKTLRIDPTLYVYAN